MEPAQRLFLGVDGGQSSSRAVIGDGSGLILGRAEGAPCNRATSESGKQQLNQSIGDLLRRAVAAAGLPGSTVFEAACFGMSGGPDDKRDILAGLVPDARIDVTNDAEVALDGACPGRSGVVVIAGTGAIAVARNSFGTLIRRGGWGHVFGDEGSAFDIVRLALRAALSAEEGWGEPTALREMFLDATGCRTAIEALHRFYDPDWPRSRVASLAPLVDRAAHDGDATARFVMERTGTALASLGGRVSDALPLTMGVPKVYALGGVFRSSSVRNRFTVGLRAHDLVVGEPAHDAAVGALLRAYRLVGLAVSVREEE